MCDIIIYSVLKLVHSVQRFNETTELILWHPLQRGFEATLSDALIAVELDCHLVSFALELLPTLDIVSTQLGISSFPVALKDLNKVKTTLATCCIVSFQLEELKGELNYKSLVHFQFVLLVNVVQIMRREVDRLNGTFVQDNNLATWRRKRFKLMLQKFIEFA